MKTYKSFRAFLASVITPRGYEMRRPGRWYKTIGIARLVVAADAKRFEPGVYIDYGLTFPFKTSADAPEPSQCLIFGENPAISDAKFFGVRQLMRDLRKVCRDSTTQKQLSTAIHKQLDCLESWADPEVLWRQVPGRRIRGMLYDGIDFEGDFLQNAGAHLHMSHIPQ